LNFIGYRRILEKQTNLSPGFAFSTAEKHGEMSGRKPTFLLVRPGFPATRRSPTATYAAFRKESRMKLVNANNLDRKSGGPDFLPRGDHRRQRMRLSVKKAA
jgi:hypothetical protein